MPALADDFDATMRFLIRRVEASPGLALGLLPAWEPVRLSPPDLVDPSLSAERRADILGCRLDRRQRSGEHRSRGWAAPFPAHAVDRVDEIAVVPEKPLEGGEGRRRYPAARRGGVRESLRPLEGIGKLRHGLGRHPGIRH